MGCALQNQEGENTIALIGDSHARALYQGILAKESTHDSAALFSYHCALPLLGAQAGCGDEWLAQFPPTRYNYKYMEDGFNYVLNHPNLKKIVLTGFPGCFDHGGLKDLSDLAITDKRQILERAAAKTFKTLTDAGKQVLFVFDVPTLASNFNYLDGTRISACINKLGSANQALGLRAKLMRHTQDQSVEHACTFDRKDGGTYEAHTMLKEVVTVEAQKYQNVKTIDLSDLLCDKDSVCSIQKDGNVLYSDPNHLSLNGAIYVAPEILRLLDSF